MEQSPLLVLWGCFCLFQAFYTLSKLPYHLRFAKALGLPNAGCGTDARLEVSPLFRTGEVQVNDQRYIAVCVLGIEYF